MKKPTVSLVIIDTEVYELSYAALRLSLEKFNFSEVIIFTDNKSAWGKYPVMVIPKIKSYYEYNNLMLNQLPTYIKTDFCLVIQYDGYILNSKAFSKEFYQYDYIGAPWPWHDSNNVGNGGFSWRSKKLLNAVMKLDYLDSSHEPEDDFICRANRKKLEDKYDCQFAPVEVANLFSIEHGSRDFPTFGFHGVWHLVKIYKNDINYFLENLPTRLLKSDMHFYFIHKEMKLYTPDKIDRLIQLRKKCFSFYSIKRYHYFKKIY